jgi:hypothetical protein
VDMGMLLNTSERVIPIAVTTRSTNHEWRLWAGEESAQMIALRDGCGGLLGCPDRERINARCPFPQDARIR